MVKKIFAGFAFAAAILAQTAAPPPALNKPALEAYIRHLLVWPPYIEVTLGEPAPSGVPGLFAVKVRGSIGEKAQEETFYISADSRTVIRGQALTVGQNPFQADLDLLKTDDQPVLGYPSAPVTVVEFADFQCPYCKEESAVVRNQLMRAFPKDVKLIYMDYPLVSIHPFALGAAVLGRCIYTQSNVDFWGYHDWIFAHQAEITPENLRDKVLEYAANDTPLDLGQLKACAVAAEPRAEIERTRAMGNALHVNATPTFFVNGRRMVGAVPLEDLTMAVQDEIDYAQWLRDNKETKTTDVDCCSVQLALPGMAK